MQPGRFTHKELFHVLAKGLWARLCAGIILTLLASGLALPLAYVIREAFDKWIPQSDSRSLLLGGMALFVLRATASLLAIATRVINVDATERMTVRIRDLLVGRLFRVSRKEHDGSKAGNIHDLVVTESQRFHMMANHTVGRVFPSLIKTFVLTLVLAYLSWRLLAIMVVVWPLVWLINEAVRRYMVKKVQIANRTYRAFSGALLERVRLLDLIRFEHQEQNECEIIHGHVREASDAARPVSILDTAYLEVQAIVLTVISVAVLTAGGDQVSSGLMTVGDFISFYMVVSLLNQALRDFAQGLYHVFVGRESWDRMLAWLNDEDSDVYHGEEAVTLTDELSAHAMDFSYRQGESLLEGLDLRLQRGQTAVLLGPNGCGKSTILWLLLGLYRPRRGEVRADGVSYDSIDMGQLRSQIGMVPQEAMLLDASVRENVKYGHPQATDEEIERALGLAGSGDWLKKLPQGLDTEMGRQGTLLSGGQRQRISLARALLKKPTFLFFDEPTNHLDDGSVCDFLATIQSLNPAPGVLIITHDNALKRVADVVYELKNGRLVRADFEHRKEPVER
jgi:ABC-type multidrug transport system fused ATPase/permease subunit